MAAFTVEPAVFVFSRQFEESLPPSHIALLDWLREPPSDRARVGTYDIETSADGYDIAASDSNQDTLYGRLLEGLGRSDIRLYCQTIIRRFKPYRSCCPSAPAIWTRR